MERVLLICASKFTVTVSLVSKPESTDYREQGLECKKNERETIQEACKKEREQLEEQEVWKKVRLFSVNFRLSAFTLKGCLIFLSDMQSI